MIRSRYRSVLRIVLVTGCVLLLVTLSGSLGALEPPDPGGLGPYATNSVTLSATNSDTGNDLEWEIYYPANNGDVEPSGAPYPALVFAHGLMAPRASNSGNAAHLASWGHIVMLPDLVNDLEDRYSDIRFLLSYLEDENADSSSKFYQKVDMNRLSITGHSLGGASTWMLAARDERVKLAAVPLDAVVGMDFLGGGTWDFEAEAPDITAPIGLIVAPSHMCNANAQYDEVYPLVSSTHKAKILIEGGNHCDFMDAEDQSQADACNLLCGGEWSEERLRLIEQYSAAWFNYYLHFDTDYYAYLYGAQAAEDIDAGRISMEVDTAPRDVAATEVGGTVEVGWTLYDHPIIAGYNIYRSQQSGDYPSTPYAQVGRVSSFVDTTPVAGQQNYYVVRSRDAAGNEHQASAEVSALPKAEPPGVPILLEPFDGAVTADASVTFAWTPGAGGAPDGYELKVDGTVYDTTGTTWSGDLSLGVHTWTVRAYKGSDYSDWASPGWSVEVAETLPPPGVPVLLAPPDGEISISRAITFVWEPSAGGLVETYNIKVDGEVMTTTQTAWPTALSNGAYAWTVRAQNASGTSDWAPEWALEVLSYPVYLPIVMR